MGKDNIISKRFGRLTVIDKIGSKNKISIYKCKCDCGNYTVVYRTNLVNQDIKSCGCLKEDFYKNRLNEQIKKYQVDGTNLSYIVSNKLSKVNTSGVKGVCKKKNGKWVAQITFQNKTYNLGTYEKKKDAVNARAKAEEKRLQYLREKGLLD